MKNSLQYYFENSKSIKAFANNYFVYLIDLIRAIDTSTVSAMINEINRADRNGRIIYFIGNGGSAALASHYANDLMIGTRADGHMPIKAVSLTDNQPLITALANDEGYDMIFLRQMESVLKEGDVVIALSVSGNSKNVVKALQYAKLTGAVTMGITGFDGGQMKEMTDIILHIPTNNGEYGPVEDIFSIIGHLIYSYLKMNRRSKDVVSPLIQSASTFRHSNVQSVVMKGR